MKRQVRKEEIVTVEKMAEELELAEDTINLWREKGMPTIKIGKYLRVYRPHVYDWIVEQGEALEKEERQMALFKRGKIERS
jgi:DNA-binding XRE family transcriptional regulator